MKENLKFIVIGFVLTGFSYLICMLIGIPIIFNWLEFLAVATSYTCTILFMLQKRVAYSYGVISTFFLCVFFWTQGIFALAIFNGILVFSLVYGYWRWGPDGRSIPVTHINNMKSLSGYFMFFIVVACMFAVLVGLGSKMDLFLAAGSATAQLALDQKKIETWYMWIVINIVSIPFFIQSGFILLAIQFTMFLINAVVALFRWHSDMDNNVHIFNTIVKIKNMFYKKENLQ